MQNYFMNVTSSSMI